jgi:hypothetical protein
MRLTRSFAIYFQRVLTDLYMHLAKIGAARSKKRAAGPYHRHRTLTRLLQSPHDLSDQQRYGTFASQTACDTSVCG